MIRFRRRVYCDNNATTLVSPSVRKKIDRVLRDCYGNPSSLYKVARDSAAVLEASRRAVAAAIHAEPGEIIFTGSASEANNSVLKSVAEEFPAKRKIVSTPIEHASVLGTLDYLRNRGSRIDFIPVDRMGRIDFLEAERLVDGDTSLVCCMMANNENGVVQDVGRLAAVAHARGALVMSDCVQALGKVAVDVKGLGLDYASFSAHKIHGPKGVGALYVREGAPFSPFIHGGHQENGRRAGTEGLHNIAGFAAACEAVEGNLARMSDTARLRDRLVEGLGKAAPVVVNTPLDGALPNTANVTLTGHNNAVLMAMLDYYGIAVSAGSACNTGEDAPSHVLTALGLTDAEARQTLRFSLSADTRDKDIDYVLKIVGDYVAGRTMPVSGISPGQLDENLLLDPETFVADVRYWYDRKLLKGLPGSVEFSLFSLKRDLRHIPRDKNILVVCQNGYDAPIAAYYLRSKGFRTVSFLMYGLFGWKLAKPDLYARLAGRNIRKAGERP